MKKLFCFLLTFTLFLSYASSAYAGEVDKNKIKAKSVVLMDLDSGKVIYKSNELEHLSPASVTKIMSILLVLEALDSGRINLKDKVTATQEAVSMGGSQIWLEVGEQMTVDELLKAVVVSSANDACTLLGEYIAGSNTAFVELMNKRANELKLKNTNFENCTGLDDSVKNHYSCAYDLALITKEVMKHSIITNYTTIWLDSLRNGKTELNNTNKLVNSYDGITGLKTGTTSNAGFCVVATAKRNDLNLVAVVLGSSTSDDRFDTARYLLDYGFGCFVSVTPKVNHKKIKKVKVLNGEEKIVELEPKKIDNLILPLGEDELSYKYSVNESVKSPVKKGQKLGEVQLFSNSKKVGTIDLIAKKNISRTSFKFVFWKLIRNM